MRNKKITLSQEARDKLSQGLNDLANAVKVTLGPRGRNVAIENERRLPTITKDGVSVARSISFSDREKNMGASIIKSVAQNANLYSGDGTTTATVLAQELYNEGSRNISMGFNPVLIKRGLDLACEIVCKELDSISKEVSSEEDIISVATISTNNDKGLGKLIAETVSSVGENGSITVVNGGGFKTAVTYSDGFNIDNGYISPIFINNPDKLRSEFETPFIMVYDGVLSLSTEVVPVMTKVSETGRPLVVIARGFEGEAYQTFALNHQRGALKSCLIKAPGFGDIRRDMTSDISLYTGAKLFSEEDKTSLQNITLDDLGTCESLVASQNKTTIVGAKGSSEEIVKKVEQLKYMLENTDEFDLYDHQVSAIVERLSKLAGVVATIKVGGLTESEQKEKKDRVEDSINAVRAAIQSGVVSGGGSALLHCLPKLKREQSKLNLNSEENIGFAILEKVLTAPLKQILKNAGVDYHPVLTQIMQSDNITSGYDALNLRFEQDMLETGIIDPVKVVKNSLSCAISAVGVLLTTEALISYENDDLE